MKSWPVNVILKKKHFYQKKKKKKKKEKCDLEISSKPFFNFQRIFCKKESDFDEF